MRGIIINERATPPMRKGRVMADLRTVRALDPTWVAWNELGKWARYRAWLQAVFTAAVWVHLFHDSRNMVSLRRDGYEVLGKLSQRLHDGLAGVNPARFNNVVFVRDRATGAIFAILNAHLANGAFNRKHPATRWWRRLAHAWGIGGITETVDLLYALGISCIGVGDYNQENTPKFHPDMVWLFNGGGIMKMWLLEAPGGARFQNIETRRIKTGVVLETDHDALVLDCDAIPAEMLDEDC